MKFFTLLFLMQSLLVFYPNQARAENEYPDCVTGYHKNDTTKKCDMDGDIAAIGTGAAECEKLYPSDEAKRRECLITNAQNNKPQSFTDADKRKHAEGAEKLEKLSRFVQPIWSATNIMFMASKGSCQLRSATALALAGLTSAAGEVWGFFKHRKKIKELVLKYKDTMNDASTTTAQKEAFEFLAAEQMVKAEADKHRRAVYLVSSSIYVIAGALALWEFVQSKNVSAGYPPNLCTSKESKISTYMNNPLFKPVMIAAGLVPAVLQRTNISGKSSDDELEKRLDLDTKLDWKFDSKIDFKKFHHELEVQFEDTVAMEFRDREMNDFYFNQSSRNLSNEYIEQKIQWDLLTQNSFQKVFKEIKSQLWISEASASGPNGTAASQGLVDIPLPKATLSPDEILKNQQKSDSHAQRKTSLLRLAGATAMASLGYINANNSKKSAEIAEERAAIYTEISTRMAALQDSDLGICKAEERSDPAKPECYCYNEDNAPNPDRLKSDVCTALFKPKMIDKKPTDYSKQNSGPGLGCVAINGVFDQACKCRELKDKSGNNACMKMTEGIDVNGLIGPNTFGNAAFRDANSLFSGNLSAGALSGGNYSGLSNAISNLKKKANAELAKLGQPPIDFKKAFNKFLSTGMAELKPLIPASGFAGTGGASGSDISNVLSQKDMDKLEKTAAANGIKESDITFKPISAAAKAKEESKFDLSGLEGAAGPEQLEMNGNIMAKNFDYKNNDISNNSTESLFKMISNRYIHTGLQRLFEEIPAKPPIKK